MTGAVAAGFNIEFVLVTYRQLAGAASVIVGVVVEREDRAGCARIDIDGAFVGDLDAVKRGAVTGAVAAGFDIEFALGTDRQRAGAGSSDRSVVVECEDRAGCAQIDIDGAVVGDVDAVKRGAVAGALAAGFDIKFAFGTDRQLAGARSLDRGVVVERKDRADAFKSTSMAPLSVTLTPSSVAP